MPESRQETRAEIIARMERRYTDIRGPGMGGSIRGSELKALLDEIHDLRAGDVAGDKQARREARAAARVAAGETDVQESVLDEVMPAINDILESHADLWGIPLVEALAAWSARQTFEVPETWVPAVAEALEVDDVDDPDA